jgi:thiosulfate dehydrogenase (quinone) large subunit
MTFLFAYIASQHGSHDWPVALMHRTEAAFVIVAVVCLLLGMIIQNQIVGDVLAAVGAVSASFGSIMPFELAPFFFGSRGEVMMASILLIFAYPVGAIPFLFLFRGLMNMTRKTPTPPPLP